MGCVFDIKRYAIHDGPGIRLTVFLKGCPLSCVWCHNPEGISRRPEKMYTHKKCIGCGYCVKACQAGALSLTPEGVVTQPDICSVCGACTDVCPALAMETSGGEMTVEEIMTEIRKNRLFMEQSGGGVTFCGGEPLLQKEFLLSLLQACGREGIHRVVDTSLYAPAAVVKEVMAHTDMFLVDLKVMDPAKHQYYCGVSNVVILHNIRRVAEAAIPFHIRIPLIREVNGSTENMEATARFLSSLPWRGRHIELLPYHDIGKNKHQKLGTEYNPLSFPLTAPTAEEIEEIRQLFYSYGIEAVVG